VAKSVSGWSPNSTRGDPSRVSRKISFIENHHWRLIGVRLAFAGYAASMKVNPVVNCTLIIRSQAEYSAATQSVILRCILESPATGRHHGFTDLASLIAAIEAELTEIQKCILPSGDENRES
jgi:hypothetical protein